MIEGALIALGGFLVGRFLPGRRRKDETVKPICGCRHSVSFHKNGIGKCEHLTTLDRNRCPCQHYVGPKSMESYFMPELLPPSDS